MLRFFGAELAAKIGAAGARAITVCGDAELHGAPIAVPGDPSSAAFLIAAALICAGSDIVVENVLLNPTRSGFIETSARDGREHRVLDRRDEGGEPVGDLRVRSSALKGVRVPRRARAVDDRRISGARCLAAFAEGETAMEGLAELKVKESDRLAATAAGLAACGVAARVEGDDLCRRGQGRGRRRRRGRDAYGPPHRHGLSDARARRRATRHCRRHEHDRHELPRLCAPDDQARSEFRLMIIAIDGPAASGKGTLGKLIAAHYGLAPSRHRQALPRSCARYLGGRRTSPLKPAQRLRRPTRSIPRRSTIRSLMDGRLGEAASIVARPPGSGKRCSPISAPSPEQARRRHRRPRHRHGHLP